MKKIMIGIILMLLSITLTGCFIYGKGQTTGYIFSVEDGIFWDKVWFKSSIESSDPDCYLLQKGSDLKEQLENIAPDTQIQLNYNRHFFTATSGDTTNDEIISFEIIK